MPFTVIISLRSIYYAITSGYAPRNRESPRQVVSTIYEPVVLLRCHTARHSTTRWLLTYLHYLVHFLGGIRWLRQQKLRDGRWKPVTELVLWRIRTNRTGGRTVGGVTDDVIRFCNAVKLHIGCMCVCWGGVWKSCLVCPNRSMFAEDGRSKPQGKTGTYSPFKAALRSYKTSKFKIFNI
jgi:hypothetical protein